MADFIEILMMERENLALRLEEIVGESRSIKHEIQLLDKQIALRSNRNPVAAVMASSNGKKRTTRRTRAKAAANVLVQCPICEWKNNTQTAQGIAVHFGRKHPDLNWREALSEAN